MFQRTTVTAGSYEHVSRVKFPPILQEKRLEKAANVIFLQDNAPTHGAVLT